MRTYHLYIEEDGDKYLLAVHDRAEVTNSDEQSIEAAINAEDLSVEKCASKYLLAPRKVGVMEDFPIGDTLYESVVGDVIDLWFSPNAINSNYLILGTASCVKSFHSEAEEEYGNMVGDIAGHKQVKAVIQSAI